MGGILRKTGCNGSFRRGLLAQEADVHQLTCTNVQRKRAPVHIAL